MLIQMYFQMFLISFIMVGLFDARGKQSIARIDRLDLCRCGDSQQECVVDDFDSKITHKENATSIIAMKFSFKVSINRIKIEAECTKCKSRESLDSCEKIGTLKPINTCELIAMKGTMWQDYVYSFQPNFLCPLIKGKYESHNATINVDMFKVFPVSGLYWKLKLNIYNETRKKYLWTLCGDGYAT